MERRRCEPAGTAHRAHGTGFAWFYPAQFIQNEAVLRFYRAYRNDSKVSPLVTQLSWTHYLIILGQSKRPEEREFYLRLAIREKWSKRELERQFRTALFERAVLSPPKVSPTGDTNVS